MLDYSGWERKEFNVTGLKLDPSNPRVSGLRQDQINQSSLLSLFIEHYGVYDLAESISKNGYFPDEVIMVFRENELNRYVLEGNRRVAALKLLLNPDGAPDKYKSKFRKLSDTITKTLIQKVQAVVAPSREAATPIVIEKHTHTPIKPWSVLMQATYVKNMLEKSANRSLALEQWGYSDSDFDRFLRMDIMYRLACSLDLPEDVLAILRNKEKFPITNIERLYNNPRIRETLRISDDLQEVYDRETFEKTYKTIIIDICKGKKDSRSLNTVYDREQYAKELKSQIPVIKKPQAAKVSEIISESKELLVEYPRDQKSIKTRSTKKSIGIIPSGFAFSLNQGASLRKICDELKKLQVDKFPNISAISFRIFLEKSIKIFLKMNKVKTIPANGIEKNIADVLLGPLLEYLSDRNITLIADDNVKKNLRIFKNANKGPSLSLLNSLVHNEEFFLSSDQARDLWPHLERLFIIMLSERKTALGRIQNSPKVPRREKSSI